MSLFSLIEVIAVNAFVTIPTDQVIATVTMLLNLGCLIVATQRFKFLNLVINELGREFFYVFFNTLNFHFNLIVVTGLKVIGLGLNFLQCIVVLRNRIT